ncbi:MAG: 2-O-(6-phospho-alpha-D-mannosyl)-D-glycerate hydrolase, partial [Acidimicrobiaceae bacterium]
VHIVPHTHWDREWYSAFQTFRLRLVDLLDDLLPRLEADPSYAHFMLDGQMAVVDDYLAVRPEAEAVLRRLAASGRLSVGPWYILMDEFLVSGETMVRNAQLGLDRAASFGGAMDLGYLPDMFGHVAQMPQLLRQLGFEHAVVWRGVPSAVDRSGFWWRAPDGSTVRAEYLPHGYGNGAVLPDDAKELVARIGEFERLQGELLTGPILWMNGTDHLAPQPWLGRVVAEANEIQDDFELVVTSLAQHVRLAPTEGLPTWTGELRSGARANLLMGVASNRVDVRRAVARAERALEQLAEPVSALFLSPLQWPRALLDEAWLAMIRNSAHDSICACSIDEVCDAVLYRYAEASRIAEGLTARAVDALGATLAGRGPVVVNPSARDRGGLVELITDGDDEVPGTQTLSVRPREMVLMEFPSPALAAGIVAELDYAPRYHSASIEATDDGSVLFRAERRAGGGSLISPDDRKRLQQVLEDTAPRPVRVRVTQDPGRKVLTHVVGVPGYGWMPWAPPTIGLGVHPVVAGADGASLDNGLVSIAVAQDGTWSTGEVTGLGRLVHGGDVGDTYNWCPPDGDIEIDTPERVRVSVAERGPLRGRLEITSTYRWPERHGGELVDVDVTTTLELRAGERLARVETAWNNRCRDQRVRVVLPLPTPATTSRAECAFAIVERGLTAEGGPSELGLPTFPSRRFVQAGGLTVAHEGLPEYELVDITDGQAHALAITLARCTGMLSQGPMATRPLPAGPFTRMEGPQLQKPISVRYALAIGEEGDPYALVEDAFVPLLVTRAGGGSESSSGQALAVHGAEVSALQRTPAGALELRVFNPTEHSTTVTVDGRTGWLVDLRGRPIQSFSESFDLAPFQIATAVLAD